MDSRVQRATPAASREGCAFLSSPGAVGAARPRSGWGDEAFVYDVLDVTFRPRRRKEMVKLSGQTLAPVIEVDGRVLADFDTGQLAEFWKQFEADER